MQHIETNACTVSHLIQGILQGTVSAGLFCPLLGIRSDVTVDTLAVQLKRVSIAPTIFTQILQAHPGLCNLEQNP